MAGVPAKKNSRYVIAKKKRNAFLKVLAQTGKVAEAARAVGFQDTSSLQAYRRQDEEFAAAWDIALESAADIIEEAAFDRAVHGVMEPKFYKGAIVGYVPNYSDALAMFMLRGLRPDKYRENARGGETNINFGVAILPMAAKSEDDWERRAVDMHSNQTIIEVEAKPVENTMSRVKRGD